MEDWLEYEKRNGIVRVKGAVTLSKNPASGFIQINGQLGEIYYTALKVIFLCTTNIKTQRATGPLLTCCTLSEKKGIKRYVTGFSRVLRIP